MAKKLLVLGVAYILLFSLGGCGFNLAAYKADAKAEIDAHVATLSGDDYTTENWTLIGQKVTEGKAAIDNAEDKEQVDTAKAATITTINRVETIMERLSFNTRFFLTVSDFLRDDFRLANRVYGVNYGDEGSEDMPEENQNPAFRVIIIKEQTEYQTIYTDNVPGVVDFENDMLVMYTFAHTEPCSFDITEVNIDNETLNISWKSVGVGGIPGHNNLTAPKQQWIVLQMDKLDVSKAVFSKV